MIGNQQERKILHLIDTGREKYAFTFDFQNYQKRDLYTPYDKNSLHYILGIQDSYNWAIAYDGTQV